MKFLLKAFLITFTLIQVAEAGRMYDPEVGRFISRDPSGYIDGPSLYNAYFAEQMAVDPSGNGVYQLGDLPKPQINWDNGFQYNPNASATWGDYYQWNKFRTLLLGAEALGHLPDGSRAYRHYRSGRGTDLNINYGKAYREDKDVKDGVDIERLDAKDHATVLWDKKTYGKWFKISGTDELVGAATENWQKAIGGHRAWGRGRFKVKCISKNEVEFTLELTIHMEDFYNFNKGQLDIATGLPDDPNGRFEVLGWAKSFYSRGKISNTMVWKVDPSKIKPGVDHASTDSSPRDQGRDRSNPTRDRGRSGR